MISRKDRRTEACGHLKAIIEARKILEQGCWENWHRGDKKINLPLLLDIPEQFGQYFQNRAACAALLFFTGQ